MHTDFACFLFKNKARFVENRERAMLNITKSKFFDHLFPLTYRLPLELLVLPYLLFPAAPLPSFAPVTPLLLFSLFPVFLLLSFCFLFPFPFSLSHCLLQSTNRTRTGLIELKLNHLPSCPGSCPLPNTTDME